MTAYTHHYSHSCLFDLTFSPKALLRHCPLAQNIPPPPLNLPSIYLKLICASDDRSLPTSPGKTFFITLPQGDCFVFWTLHGGICHFVIHQPFHVLIWLCPSLDCMPLSKDISGTSRLPGMIHLICFKKLFDEKFISVAVDFSQILTSVHGLNLK